MLDEYLEFLHERYLISDKTISIDLDKFISGEKKKLLIVGLSGAGKSTLCGHLAKKYKAECFMTDKCKHIIMHPNKHIGGHNPPDNILKEVFLEGYLKCARPQLKNNKRQVIEGAFVWQNYLYFPQFRNEQNHHPTIILGVSALKSVWGVLKRVKAKHDLPYAIGRIPLVFERNFKILSKRIDLFRKLRLEAGGEVEEFKVPKL